MGRNWYTPIGAAEEGPLLTSPGKPFNRTAALLIFAAVSLFVLLFSFPSHNVIGNDVLLSTPPLDSSGWDVDRLHKLSQRTFTFRPGDSHEMLQSCYAPNATLTTPLAPSGAVRGAGSILNQTINSRSFASDVSFIQNSLGLSSHTVSKDTNAVTAAVGKYVHTGVDTIGGRQCEVENPMHIFQEVDHNYQVVNEWQHVNYTAFLHNLKRCNTLNLPVGAAVASDVINKVFPDVVDYGWNGTRLADLVNRFWTDINGDISAVHESVTVELQRLAQDLALAMQEAGISTTAVTPNTPSLVVNAKSREWSTLSVVVAQEIIGMDVNTGSNCSFRMQWMHAYIIERHYRIAGFVTAGDSNDLKAQLSNCNKFGTQEYGFHNWKQQQGAASAVMDNLRKTRLLDQLLTGNIHASFVNNSLNVDVTQKKVHRAELTPTSQPTTTAELEPEKPSGNVNDDESDYCLCTSKTGCALPGSYACCAGLTCSGDSHHSECVPTDSDQDSANWKDCVTTNKNGCGGKSKRQCCNSDASCSSSKKDYGVCRLQCDAHVSKHWG